MKKKFILKNPTDKKNYLKFILDWFEKSISLVLPVNTNLWIPLLCFEEFITNIFMYSNLPFPSNIEVEIVFKKNQLLIITQDEGEFYDINAHLSKTTENQIGGCGIRLIKSYMLVQQSAYERINITKLILFF